MNDGMAIGVLALQGGFDAHRRMLARIGVEAAEIRTSEAVAPLDGLVIPGGESTTLINLMDRDPRWWDVFPDLLARGGAVFGTCAGMIMLAERVHNPDQRSLGLLDIDADRNAYGRQVDSSEGVEAWENGEPLEMVFIRAPRISRLGDGVEVLARHQGDPVLVEKDGVLAASFHPELTNDTSVHEHFVRLVTARRSVAV